MENYPNLSPHEIEFLKTFSHIEVNPFYGIEESKLRARLPNECTVERLIKKGYVRRDEVKDYGNIESMYYLTLDALKIVDSPHEKRELILPYLVKSSAAG